MSESLKHKAVHGVFWKIGEQGVTQIIYFVISVILARLILPDQFGMIAMLSVFTSIASIFIDSGFSSALIRKTNRTQEDCSTVYWFNIIVSLICYIILFFCAPFIAIFYEMPQLCQVLRVISLSIVIGSFSSVQRTLLTAEMRFKILTKFNIIGIVVSGIVGITMAYWGFQVWALVLQSLSLNIITTIFVWVTIKWRPSFVISRDSIKEFFGFGSKLLASSLLNTIYGNLYTIVIGKIYKASELAYYNRANSLPQITAITPTQVLQSVTYPTFCKLQDNDTALKEGYRRTLKISGFVVFPLCLGVGAVACPLINVLYTEVWMSTAVLLTIISFSMMWYPIHAINLSFLMVKGRSDLFFRLEVIKKVIGVIILAASAPFGLKAMCYGGIVGSLISLLCNTHYTGKFLNMGIIAQMKDLLPSVILSLVMFVGARAAAWSMGNGVISLVTSILTGIIIYVGGALLFRFPEVKELRTMLK